MPFWYTGKAIADGVTVGYIRAPRVPDGWGIRVGTIPVPVGIKVELTGPEMGRAPVSEGSGATGLLTDVASVELVTEDRMMDAKEMGMAVGTVKASMAERPVDGSAGGTDKDGRGEGVEGPATGPRFGIASGKHLANRGCETVLWIS